MHTDIVNPEHSERWLGLDDSNNWQTCGRGGYNEKEQQRLAVVDPGTHIPFLLARCRPTRPRYAAAAAKCWFCCI